MKKVIDFQAAKAAREPRNSGPAVCLACKHEWTAEAEVGAVWLTCPACSLDRGRFQYAVQLDGLHWTCNCENDLFHATPQGLYCPNCGAWQHGF